ncbi:MAG: MFS transporter [Clostridiales bacterium]|jgi:fucose permease|nr:MFS transporter [Clostridiales bacterium]
MATLLLVIIYIAFIGLGIPDSLFGTAWPAIYLDFQLPISAASAVTLLISSGTVISSLLSARLIARFGTGVVTAVSTTLTALALLGFSLSGHLAWLCIFAIPLGLGAGAIDSALNNYVALHYQASHMNFLHCFYGIGVSVSPYLVSLALSSQQSWRGGYRMAFFAQFIIAVLTIASLPLWRKVRQTSANEAEDESIVPLSLGKMAKMPSVRAVWFLFLASCAIEYTCGTWGSTYLVDTKGVTVQDAAKIITFYYVGMAVGRFVSGLLATKLSSWRLIHIGQTVVFSSILLILLPLPSEFAAVGLFLIGLGNGPIFPNLIHLTPKNFGKEFSQSIMGSQMAASYIGILLMPPLFGVFAQRIGTHSFPYFLLALFAIMTAATILLIRMLKKEKRYS